MNKRQKKKKDKEAIRLARKIIFSINENLTYWKYNSKIRYADYITYWDFKEHFKNKLKSKEMLLKVCRKSLQDNFPLEDYFLWEIPYEDKNGWIMCFVNLNDFINCHQLHKEDTKIREIDFWCPYNSRTAIPQGLDNYSNLYNCETCFDAIYDD